MPSDRKKKEKEKAKAKAAAPKGSAEENGDGSPDEGLQQDVASSSKALEELDLGAGARSCTGVLSSHPQSRDIHVDSFSLLFHGHELLQDTRLELNYGRYKGGPRAV